MRLFAAPILLINAQVLHAPLPPQQGVIHNNQQQAQPVNPPQPPQQHYQHAPPPPQAQPVQAQPVYAQAAAQPVQPVPVQAQPPQVQYQQVQAQPQAHPPPVQIQPPPVQAQPVPAAAPVQAKLVNVQPSSVKYQGAPPQNVQPPQLVSVSDRPVPAVNGQGQGGVPYGINPPGAAAAQYPHQAPQYPSSGGQQILLPNAQAIHPNLNLYGGAMPPMMVPPNYQAGNHQMNNQQGIPILPHPDNVQNAPHLLNNPQLQGLYHPIPQHPAPAGPLRDIDLPDEEYRHLQAQQNIYKQQPLPGSNQTDAIEDLAAEWDRVMTDFMPDMIVTFRLAASTQEYFNQDVGKQPVLLRGGFFESTDDSASSISFQVVSPSGKVVYRNDKGEGLFRIMTEEEGTYTFAVTNSGWSGQKYVTFVVGVGMEKGLTTDDVETLDGNVRVLYRMLGDMETQSSYLWIRQKSALESLHRTASQTYYALVVGLVIAGLATLFQISIIKRMVAHRRLF